LLRKPILLHYFITNRCNTQCQFCDIWKEQPKTDAKTDLVLPNLREARIAGCRFVDFTGGEPLIHKDLPVFCKRAKELGFITSVTTNTLLFPKRAHELVGLIDLLHFSIDADNPDLNNKIHGGKTFDSVMKSIDIALSNNLVPDLLFTYTDENINSFTGIYEYALEKRLIIILDPLFNINGKDRVSEKTHQKAVKYSKLVGVYLNKAHLLLRKKSGNSTQNTCCRAVSSTIVILPDNTLALPCYHHKTECLNITPSFLQAYNHANRLLALEEQGTYPFCEGCHINCYFDPSYNYYFNSLFLKSFAAKLSYALRKYFFYRRPLPKNRYSVPDQD
jgi:MoaA/NifB/PqqE/SkfB family radical SAM enzyme